MYVGVVCKVRRSKADHAYHNDDIRIVMVMVALVRMMDCSFHFGSLRHAVLLLGLIFQYCCLVGISHHRSVHGGVVKRGFSLLRNSLPN
jgi:hypothetical protein